MKSKIAYAEALAEDIAHTNPNHGQEVLSNPFRLSSHEIDKQYETAKVSGLKKRVRRFACWHSCFGQFRKRTLRKNKPKYVAFSEDSRTNQDMVEPSQDGNELGDANLGPRQKKSPDPAEFYKEVTNNELQDDKTNIESKKTQIKATSKSPSLIEKKTTAATTTEAPKTVLQSELEKVEKPTNPPVEEEYESGEYEENEGTDVADGDYYDGDDESFEEDKTVDEKSDADAEDDDDGIDQEESGEEV
ncbi:unnamed protein product [Orchesella dallaii]